jgi:hypothetical protein
MNMSEQWGEWLLGAAIKTVILTGGMAFLWWLGCHPVLATAVAAWVILFRSEGES